jgi:septal ring factor EnvC (AmiA/AmiB activator)
MRRLSILLALPLLGAAPVDPRVRLREANAGAVAADARAAELARAADAERNAARKAAMQLAALAARIEAAEVRLQAAQARVGITDRLLVRGRAEIAERQAPIERLVAALQTLARQPSAIALVQPGSVDDVVHVRAALGALVPEVRARTAAVRDGVARVARLRRNAALAAGALNQGRAELQTERLALVRLEAEHRARGATLDQRALAESDRAIALGERARDIVGLMQTTAAASEVAQALVQLPGPLPRPANTDQTVAFAEPPYRLPVRGRLVEGLGELSSAGVRARGLTFAVAPGAPVIAPARGRVLFARPFRDYETVVVIDHGNGWTSALTGLASVNVSIGQELRAGASIGRASRGEDARIGVELRRRDVPIDITQLID